MDYGCTIYLPTTSFPMKADLVRKESEIQKFWDDLAVNSALRALGDGREKFVLHDGPPFANGHPHAGTSLNRCLKDIIIRSYQMSGYDAKFVPGWDCHGLPIEWKVEEILKKSGINKQDMCVAEFRDRCREFALKWIDVQRLGFMRLGNCGCWDSPYLTMDPKYEATVIRVFGKMLLDGTVYRGQKPVFWSVVEKTALADAEIEYKDKISNSIYVSFKVKSARSKCLLDVNFVIWTTTPWTIPGNRAICYRQETCYLIVSDSLGEKFIVAEDLFGSFAKIAGRRFTILGKIFGDQIDGTICVHPFADFGYDFDVPLLPAEHVALDVGTGFVHTAPGHGLDDFLVCEKFGIKVPETVKDDGTYCDCVPKFAGKHIFKVEDEIISELSAVGALVYTEKITHSYPHSWRSKAPLIFRVTDQWFISLDNTGIRQHALDEIEKTSWIPAQGYNRIKSFVQNRGDWCISRQRVWGVPLPIFINKKTGNVLKDMDVIENIASIFQIEGTNAWYTRPASDFLGSKYDASDYQQSFDTLDVWFESASSHIFALSENKDRGIADLYLEGSDQHRGWFQHSLLVSCSDSGHAPFKTVLTHGFVVDEEGKKMSKSVGNTVDLQNIVDTFGADVFRLWVVSSDYTQDLRLGKNILAQQQDVYRKLRNTFRYLLGALQDFDDDQVVEYENMPLLEKWVLHRIFEIHAELQEAIKSFNVNKYFSILYNFIVQDLSSFFFDVRKDCLYCDDKTSIQRRAYRSVLDVTFEYCVRWIAPILVFTAEEIWQHRHPGDIKSSVHLSDYLVPPSNWCDESLATAFRDVRSVRRVMTSALEISRKNKLIGSSLQAKLKIFDPDGILHFDNVFWSEVAIVSNVEICREEIPDIAFVSSDTCNIGVVVSKSMNLKCDRCWKMSDDVKEYGNEKGALCTRCLNVLGQR